MATVAELLVRADARVEGFQRGIDSMIGNLNKLADRAKSVGRNLTLFVSLPILALGASTVTAAARMDQLTRGLTAVTGSSQATTAELARLREVAKLPGLGFQEAIQGAIRLQAVGFSARLAERTLLAFGNAIARTGGGKDELERITVQLGQLAARGKVTADNLRPIIEAAPAVGKAIKDAFGTLDTEEIQKRGISAQQFIERLLTELEKLPRTTGGVANEFENLSDSLFMVRAAIGAQLLPAIVPLLQGLASMLMHIEGLNPNTVRWAVAIAGVAAVAGPLIFVIASLTETVIALGAALAVGLLPLILVGGPILIGLAALSALWVKNKIDALAAAAATDAFKTSLIGLTEQQLIAERANAAADLRAAHQLEAGLRSRGEAFRRVGGRGPGRSLTPASDALASTAGGTLRETEDMRKFGEAANAAAARVHAVDGALATLAATTPKVTPPPATSGDSAKKAREMAHAVAEINDQYREMMAVQDQVALFNGAKVLGDLPDEIQAQVQEVASLANKIEEFKKTLRAAGSHAPPEAVQILDQLVTAYTAAADRLEANARKVNAGGGIGRVIVQEDVKRASVLGAQDKIQQRLNPTSSGLGSLFGGALQESTRLGQAMAALRETVHGAGAALQEYGTSQLRNAISGAVSSFAQLTPAGLAAVALSSAMEALQPVINALLVPVKIFGEIVALSVVPILRLLWPILKAVAIAASYVQEVFDIVAGGILRAVGFLIKGLGTLIDKIPGLSDFGLKKAGQALIDTGKDLGAAAKEIAKKRKELEGLSFDDALNKTTDAANKLSEALINAVQGFKIQPYRFAAAEGRAPGGGSAPWTPPGGPRTDTGSTGGAGHQITVNGGETGRETYRRLWAYMSELASADPDFRPEFLRYPRPV